MNYLENKSEKQELSPPPPITEIVERRYEETNFEGASNLFHKEIMSKLMSDSVIPLHDVVIKNNYGETVFRTGLLTTLKNDLSGTSEDLFDINLKDYILEINEGFIRNITEGDIRLKNKL